MSYEIRKTDKFGSGHFGASRGSRKHSGVDIVVSPGTPWKTLNSGTVTRLGYTYSDDLSYRYVEVTDEQGLRFRYFYVVPEKELKAGSKVKAGDVIGTTQTLQKRYPGITEHVHFEIKDAKNNFLDPNPFLEKANG